MRAIVDKILRAGIKLCLLTSVAFTFAACYGPGPYPYGEDPQFQEDQKQLAQQIMNNEEPQ